MRSAPRAEEKIGAFRYSEGAAPGAAAQQVLYIDRPRWSIASICSTLPAEKSGHPPSGKARLPAHYCRAGYLRPTLVPIQPICVSTIAGSTTNHHDNWPLSALDLVHAGCCRKILYGLLFASQTRRHLKSSVFVAAFQSNANLSPASISLAHVCTARRHPKSFLSAMPRTAATSCPLAT